MQGNSTLNIRIGFQKCHDFVTFDTRVLSTTIFTNGANMGFAQIATQVIGKLKSFDPSVAHCEFAVGHVGELGIMGNNNEGLSKFSPELKKQIM